KRVAIKDSSRVALRAEFHNRGLVDRGLPLLERVPHRATENRPGIHFSETRVDPIFVGRTFPRFKVPERGAGCPVGDRGIGPWKQSESGGTWRRRNRKFCRRSAQNESEQRMDHRTPSEERKTDRLAFQHAGAQTDPQLHSAL